MRSSSASIEHQRLRLLLKRVASAHEGEGAFSEGITLGCSPAGASFLVPRIHRAMLECVHPFNVTTSNTTAITSRIVHLFCGEFLEFLFCGKVIMRCSSGSSES